MFFDDFVSHRSSYIGLDPNALPTTPPPAQTDDIFSDSFESGDLTAWSANYWTNGSLSVSTQAKIVGSQGLQALCNSNCIAYITDWSPQQDKSYRARFYFDPNSVSLSNNSNIIFQGGSRENLVVRIALRLNGAQYQVRGEAMNDNGYWINTNWYPISDDYHAFEIYWQAATAPGSYNGNLALWIDGNLQAKMSNLDNDIQVVDYIQLGTIYGFGYTPNATVLFDDFVSRRFSYIGLNSSAPTDVIYGDGFEAGDFSAWSSSTIDGGDLSVSSDRAIITSYQLQATINDDHLLYVTDLSPTALSRYRARFYFDPNTISMAEGDSFYLFQALDATSTPNIRIEFRYQSGSYQVRSQAVDDEEIWNSNPWTNITDTHHAIEIDWQAASTIGANNGSLTFWVDGNKLSQLTGQDNDTQQVESIQLGAVDGLDAGTSGVFFMDGFESHRTTPIGLDLNAQVHTISNSIFSDGFELGDILAWSNVIGDGGLAATAQAALVGTNGLEVVVSDNNPRYLEDWTPHLEKSYNARFYFAPNSLIISDGDVISLFNMVDSSGTVIVRFMARMFTGDYQVMAEVLDNNSTWSGTPWTFISNERHAIELDWLAATAPGLQNGRLNFIIDNLYGMTYSLTGLENNLRLVEDIQMGVISGIGSNTRGTAFFDAFVSQRTNVIGLDPNPNPIPAKPDAIFADGFESGDLSNWGYVETDDGHLSVSSGAAIIGDYGLQTTFDGANMMSIIDWKPSYDNHYRARFYFDPNSYLDASGTPIDIFYAYPREGDGRYFIKICIRKESGTYQVKGWASDPTTLSPESDWIPILDGPHAIEVEWWSASSLWFHDGGFKLWMDGIQRFTTTTIGNYGDLVGYVTLGIFNQP